MSWCNKMASTPGVMLYLTKKYLPNAQLLDILRPSLDETATGDRDNFQITKSENFVVEVATDPGFYYGIGPGRLLIDFRHRLRLRAQSAGLPSFEVVSQAKPYTEMLGDLISRLLQLLDRFNPRQHNIDLEKIGIFATTIMADADAPPGIIQLRKFLGSPWSAEPEPFAYKFTAPLASNETYNEKCSYYLGRHEEQSSLMVTQFEWLRELKQPLGIIKASDLRRPIELASESALAYFEEIAEGAKFHGND